MRGLRDFLLPVGVALALAPAAAISAGHVVQTEQVRAELVAQAAEGFQPGKSAWLGLKLEHIPHWHTYWKNAGDSGLPTTLSWTLPDGVTAGDIDWPVPAKLPIGPLLNYGYEGTVLLPVPLTLTQPIAGDTLKVKLRADWLVCEVECIPQSGEFELDVSTRQPLTNHADEFEHALAQRPLDVRGADATARVVDGALSMEIRGLPATRRGHAAELFPELPGVVDNPATVTQEWSGDLLRASWPLSTQRSDSPANLPMVLVFDDRTLLRVNVRIAGPWPGDAAGAVAASGAEVTAPAPGLGFITALIFALLGGVILNLMPCVFPVLSLKILALTQHAGETRARWTSALAYTGGVVISFVALAGLLIAARAAGEQLGWGFQLQSPGIVVALAGLFTLIGLNLAGVFEFGSFLPSNVASLRARDPTLDSFLTGVLAAAVASPCTAPFMGAALGAALTWPVAQSLAVFAALGLGVAAPYLLVSAVPAIGRLLPRPGRWMQTFKVALSFPMFATVIWLTWVLGQQTGIDGAAALLLALLALALAAWWWGQRPENGLKRVLSTAAIVMLAVGAFAWASPLWQPAASRGAENVGELWQPWSPRQVEELRATGRKVFVDFTAAWCVTCQYNKRTTLANSEVLQAFETHNVALLRADWTNRDAVIAAELARLGRSGVPVYVFYDGAGAPRLLSELPSVDEILTAVTRNE
ncbi:MAG: cytochrome c biosis protein transrane region [Steroidobacteraceae bacterium]|nr:cytochrome c biosis protein transrane region [Steroidobacteraceae bacterium]